MSTLIDRDAELKMKLNLTGNFMFLIIEQESKHYGISFVSKYNRNNPFRAVILMII